MTFVKTEEINYLRLTRGGWGRDDSKGNGTDEKFYGKE